jgi:ankyrin repeat protein
MLNIIKWIIFAIFITAAFGTTNKEIPIENSDLELIINKNLADTLINTVKKGNEESVKFLLDTFRKEENENFIQFLMTGNDNKITALHQASANGQEEIVKLLFNEFINKNENKKLIEFVMKEDEFKFTSLHLAANRGYSEIVKLLLSIFKDDKDQLIQYVMNEDKKKHTALHHAAQEGHEEIIHSLLDVFAGEENQEKLIQFLMQEDINKDTALHHAAIFGRVGAVKSLCDVLCKEENIKVKTAKTKFCAYRQKKIIPFDEENKQLTEFLTKKNKGDFSALDCAQCETERDVVKMLSKLYVANGLKSIMISL